MHCKPLCHRAPQPREESQCGHTGWQRGCPIARDGGEIPIFQPIWKVIHTPQVLPCTVGRGEGVCWLAVDLWRTLLQGTETELGLLSIHLSRFFFPYCPQSAAHTWGASRSCSTNGSWTFWSPVTIFCAGTMICKPRLRWARGVRSSFYELGSSFPWPTRADAFGNGQGAKAGPGA